MKISRNSAVLPTAGTSFSPTDTTNFPRQRTSRRHGHGGDRTPERRRVPSVSQEGPDMFDFNAFSSALTHREDMVLFGSQNTCTCTRARADRQTFSEFLHGQGPVHPRRMPSPTRPSNTLGCALDCRCVPPAVERRPGTLGLFQTNHSIERDAPWPTSSGSAPTRIRSRQR